MSVYAGHNTLSRSFLITCGSVDLTSQEQVFDYFGFEGKIQLCRVEIVVFDGVCRFENLGILKSGDGMKGVQLRMQR